MHFTIAALQVYNQRESIVFDTIQYDEYSVYESSDRVDIERPIRLCLHVSPLHSDQYLLALDFTVSVKPIQSTAPRTTIDKSC